MDEDNAAILLSGFNKDDIYSVVRTLNNLKELEQDIKKNISDLNTRLLTMMKDRKWTTLKDEEEKLTVTIETVHQESINKKALNMILSEDAYSQVIIRKAIKKIQIVNERKRKEMKNYGRK